MEQLMSYFETIPAAHRSLILVGGITFFWILEGIVPLFSVDYNKWKHSLPNFFFTLTTIIVNFPLAFLLLKTSIYRVVNKKTSKNTTQQKALLNTVLSLVKIFIKLKPNRVPL